MIDAIWSALTVFTEITTVLLAVFFVLFYLAETVIRLVKEWPA